MIRTGEDAAGGRGGPGPTPDGPAFLLVSRRQMLALTTSCPRGRFLPCNTNRGSRIRSIITGPGRDGWRSSCAPDYRRS